MTALDFGAELAAFRKVGPLVGSAVALSLAFMAALTLTLLRGLGITG